MLLWFLLAVLFVGAAFFTMMMLFALVSDIVIYLEN